MDREIEVSYIEKLERGLYDLNDLLSDFSSSEDDAMIEERGRGRI